MTGSLLPYVLVSLLFVALIIYIYYLGYAQGKLEQSVYDEQIHFEKTLKLLRDLGAARAASEDQPV